MKKKVLVVFLVICLILSNTTTALADSSWQTITALFNGINVKVNGKNVQADNILYDGTTYLPLRAISNALGANVNYIDETKTAEITLNSAAPTQVFDRNSVEIASVYVEFEQLSDLIDSRQRLSSNIVTSYMIGGYDPKELSNSIAEYEKIFTDTTTHINDYSNLLDSYLSEFSGMQSMASDFSLVKSYFKDIEIMESSMIKLVRNIITYEVDDTAISRYYSLQHAIDDSIIAIRELTSSNYYNITNYILESSAYAPASKSLNLKNSYFIAVPTEIN